MIVHKTRIVLIEMGKQLPFIFCFVLAISYSECIYALATQNFVVVGDDVFLRKPISWFLGGLFEYSVQFIIIAAIISIAIQTCHWNKLAICYLLFQLYEKYYFSTHQWDNANYYYFIISINLAICVFFIVKGLQVALKH